MSGPNLGNWEMTVNETDEGFQELHIPVGEDKQHSEQIRKKRELQNVVSKKKKEVIGP